MATNVSNRTGNVKNLRSHSLRATKKRQKLNLQVVRLENGKKVKLKEIECHTLSVDTPKDLEKVREVIQKKIDREG